MIPVILASRSPRRTELLRLIGVPHRVAPSGAPEDALAGESPRDQVLRLACDKAEAVLSREAGDVLVIGADTLVVLDREALGQPRDVAEAAAMLRRLSGRTHTVLTGVCLARPGRPRARGVSESRVAFHAMDEGEIAAYAASGEPMDKAGAYAAQGLGAVFLAGIEGSFHNVVGFPLDLFYRLLPGVGLTLAELRGGRT
ncbi:MAG: Maf family protein [Acidobacteriota bacterium]